MTTGAVDTFVTAASASLIALFGFNYYAMVWAFVGALVALTKSDKVPHWGRAVFFVLLSTFIGALISTAFAEFMKITTRSVIAILALLGGVGWQGFIALLIKAMEAYIRLRTPQVPATHHEPARTPPE